MDWRRLSGKRIKKPIKQLVEETIKLERAKGHKLKVCIGSDSEVRGSSVDFATVILFLREGKGGFMYISNSKTSTKMGLKERMLREVAKSIEVAYSMVDMFEKYDIELELHADVNSDPNFKSNVA